MLDLKITGGRIVDGMGTAAYTGDVGIRDGRIVALGKVAEQATRTITADGLAVAPGFIDVHTHYDAQAFWDPLLSPSSLHGVTTIFGGFCGFSIAPLTPDAADYLLPMLARVEGMPVPSLTKGVPWNWTSFGSYLDKLEGKLAINAGFSVGHSAVRRVAMGARAVGEKATEDEMRRMEDLVAQSIAEGAMGFSTTCSPSHNDANGDPVPSRWASDEELMRLAKVVSRYEGTTLELLPDITFPPGEAERLANYSLAGQRPVNWNLLTIANPAERARAEKQLSATDYARSRGAEVLALALPFVPTIRINLHSGFVFDSLPEWAQLFHLPPAVRLERLKDPGFRRVLAEGALKAKPPFDNLARWDNYRVVEIHAVANKKWQGQRVGDIAAQLGESALDVMFDLAIADQLHTSFMPYVPSDDLATMRVRAEFMRDNRTIVGGSDAGAHMDMIDSFALGTRLLQSAVREHGVLSLEEGVQMLTSSPAALFGLRQRGSIAIGNFGDLTIFDPATVGCGPIGTRFDLPAGEGRLTADATGIEHVIVNGQPIIERGRATGGLGGKILRSGRDSATVAIKGHA